MPGDSAPRHNLRRRTSNQLHFSCESSLDASVVSTFCPIQPVLDLLAHRLQMLLTRASMSYGALVVCLTLLFPSQFAASSVI